MFSFGLILKGYVIYFFRIWNARCAACPWFGISTTVIRQGK